MVRRQHGRYHDATVLGAAVVTLGAVWFAFHLTATDPVVGSSLSTTDGVPILAGNLGTPQQVGRVQPAHPPAREAAQTPSRTQVRVPVPVPLHVVPEPSPAPTPGVRVGKPNPGAGLIPPLRCIRSHESGGDYNATNPTSGASGAWQFLDGTWEWITGRPAPAEAYPRDVQDAAAIKLFRYDPNQWTTYSACVA